MAKKFIFLVIGALLLISPLHAQVTTSAMNGRVTEDGIEVIGAPYRRSIRLPAPVTERSRM